MELSHAGPKTGDYPRLPGKPQALPGVGSSDLVRQSNTHRLRKLRSDSPPKTRWRQAHRGARNVTEKPTEHTKRNLRRRRGRAQPPNSTGGNRGNRGSTPSQFAPLPPVQNAQRCSLMPNDQAHRPPSPDFWKTQNSKAPAPSANGGSVQRPCSATCSSNLKNLRSDSFRKRCDNRPGHCARNVTEKPAKLTKRNPRRRREMAQPPNSTGGNGGNRGSIPSQLAPLPPVSNGPAPLAHAEHLIRLPIGRL